MRTLNIPMDDELFDALEKVKADLCAEEGRILGWKDFLELIVKRFKK